MDWELKKIKKKYYFYYFYVKSMTYDIQFFMKKK